MSKIGRLPIKIPAGVKVALGNSKIEVTGRKGPYHSASIKIFR